jgi:hypothetical protein
MDSPGGLSSRGRLLDGRLSRGWSLFLGLGWPLAFMAMVAVEPPPADPDAAVPVLVQLAGLAFWLAMGTTIIAALSRHPLAALGGVATGLLAAAFSITCPASGHHGFGLWWFVQIGAVAAMLVPSAVALLQRPPAARRSAVGDAGEHVLHGEHRRASQALEGPHVHAEATAIDEEHLDRV